MLADIGTLSGEVETQVDNWVKKGGVLVRFAGPRLEKGGDPLLPVALRIGGRTLGGALSWSTPQPLAPFDEKSLFAGLEPKPDVTVNRQVLADPGALGPDVDVWARLKDGTPLVTRQATWRGPHRALPHHGQLRLVQPAALGAVRRHAATDRNARPARRRGRGGRDRRRRRQRTTPTPRRAIGETC